MEKSGGKLGDGLLSGVGRALKVGAVAVGAAAVGGLGTALVKGFARLDTLDQATAKLTGLGHSAETVQTIMDNALASVRGTAFGMGEAATSAAGAVAAGIKPGKDLERTLKAVADASTIAGTDMGSMGAIFNKVAASNKVQMDVINQLHDAGVPALALLAEQMGVTAEEASKMASKGKIDFATFQSAMESGMGGAALKSGETFSGAMDNVGAALGRVGANLLSGIFPQLKDGLGGIQDMLAPLEDGAKKFGAAFGGIVALVVKGDFTAGLRDAFGWEEDTPIVSFIFDLRDNIGALVSEVSGGVQAMVAAFQDGGDDVTSSGLAGFMESVGLAARKVADFVSGTLMPALSNFGGWVVANKDWIIAIAVAVGGAAIAMKAWTTAIAIWQGITKAATAIQFAFNLVMAANPIMLVIMAIAALVAGLVYFFTQTETGRAIWETFTQVVGTAMTWLWETILKPIFDAIGAIFGWLWDNIILPIVTSIMLYVGLWAAAFEWLWNTILKPVFDKIGEIFTWIWETIIQPIINYIELAVKAWGIIFDWLWANAIKPALDKVGEIFTWLWDTIIKPVADFIGGAIETVGNTIEDVFGGISDFIGNAFQSVLNVVRGPINALIDLINGVIGGLNSISVDIPDWVPLVGGQTWGLNIPKIPRLAEGGIIRKTQGGILANIGEGRYDEAVVPLTPEFMESLAGGGKRTENRPIYADGTLLGWLRQEAGKEAQLVFNRQLNRGFASTVGSR
ncbi:tape measure protein [Cryobacterium sp. BB736]|uniref:tape measure protein n=1 Tax=Cryobacterium sp. BB736 TaxID=2746963 RepID=UPI001875AAFC|nr:tape measure protein [Cryobacterium sp. BB736]